MRKAFESPGYSGFFSGDGGLAGITGVLGTDEDGVGARLECIDDRLGDISRLRLIVVVESKRSEGILRGFAA